MPRRRQFGHVFRKPRPGKPGESGRTYHPGWYVRIRHGGGELLRYGGADRGSAVEFLRRLQSDLERQELLGQAPENQRTFADFAADYLAWAKRAHTKDTYERARSAIEGTLVPHFGARRLQDVSRPDVERFLMSNSTWKAATRNRYQSLLSALYKRAIELGHVPGNPAAGVRRGKEDRTALPLIPAEGQEKLLDAMPPELLTLVTLALDTGARLGELMRLRWADLDLKERTIQVRKAKNHRPRNLSMPGRLHALLKAQSDARGTAATPQDLLFADLLGTDGRLKAWPHRKFKAAAARAGFPALRFHDLRHLTAINLIRGGLDLPAIQATLGHTSLQSTFRYAEYADGSAAERAAAVLDRMRVGGALAGGLPALRGGAVRQGGCPPSMAATVQSACGIAGQGSVRPDRLPSLFGTTDPCPP